MRCRPDATPAVLLTCWAAGSWLRRSRTDQPWTRARASTQSWPESTGKAGREDVSTAWGSPPTNDSLVVLRRGFRHDVVPGRRLPVGLRVDDVAVRVIRSRGKHSPASPAVVLEPADRLPVAVRPRELAPSQHGAPSRASHGAERKIDALAIGTAADELPGVIRLPVRRRPIGGRRTSVSASGPGPQENEECQKPLHGASLPHVTWMNPKDRIGDCVPAVPDKAHGECHVYGVANVLGGRRLASPIVERPLRTRARASTQSWPGRTAARREECRSPSPDQQDVMPARSARARARPTFSSARDAEPLRHTSEPGVERPQPRAGYERRRQQMRVDPPDPDAEQPAPPNEGKHFFVQCDRKLRQPVKVGWRQQISTPDSAPASGWRRVATAESASG